MQVPRKKEQKSATFPLHLTVSVPEHVDEVCGVGHHRPQGVQLPLLLLLAAHLACCRVRPLHPLESLEG